MFEFSYPYIIISIIYLILGYCELTTKNNIRKRRKIQIIECFVFILFFGLRGYVGTDWLNYYLYYQNLSDNYGEFGSFEPGFDILVRFCSYINIDYCVFVFLITIVQGYLFDKYFSRKVDYMFWTYLLLMAIFPNLIIDTIRNFISLLIGMFALEFWKKGHELKTLLLIIMSILFHVSGLVFVFLLPFCKKFINKWVVITIFVVVSIVYFTQFHFTALLLITIGNLVGGIYSLLIDEYVNSDIYNSSYGISLGIIEKFLFFILYIYKYDEIKSGKYVDPIISNVFCLYIFSNLLFSDMNILIQRFAVLFCFGYILMIPNLIKMYSLRINRCLISCFIFLIVFLKISGTYNIPILEYDIFMNYNLVERKIILEDYYSIVH